MNNKIENKVEGQRIDTGIEAKKSILTRARQVQDRMLNNLPSNYSRDRNTNLAEFYRAIAEEFSRLEYSADDINNDKFHTNTRAEYLFIVLGDLLFLGERSINASVSDVEYRDFLIKVRNGYIGGSRPDNIEASVSDIIGLPVTLKEVYQSLRLSTTSYTIKDTHKMFFDILMDNFSSSSDVGQVLSDLKFFISLIKPAHVLYDTRLIYTENIYNRGDCTPKYSTIPMQEVVYFSSEMYVATYVANSVYLSAVETGEEGWETGVISAIDTVSKVIRLDNNKILVYEGTTNFFRRNVSGVDVSISASILQVGDEIKYFAEKDSSSTSDIITSDWDFSGVISAIDTTDEIITLSDGSKIVYNSDTLIYTRDGKGEYRITVSDLKVSREIVFKGTKYTEAFQFFNTPEKIENNNYKQFDQSVIDRPYFQNNVKKVLETRDGLTEGYHTIVEDGMVKVIKVDGKFYDKKASTHYEEKRVYRYSLYIDGSYQTGAQFTLTEPQEAISTSEAKQIFIDQFGYTSLENPFTDYDIKISQTGKLFETDGSASIDAVGTETESCDRDAECFLSPFYEDTRKYWTWPEVELTSGFIVLFQNWDVQDSPGEQNVPAYYAISNDPNQYDMPLLPVLDVNGDPAKASDLTVYVNGLKVDNAVSTLDPWSGIITLNFLPPFNSTVRVDYYYANRYPTLNSYSQEIRTDIEDLPGDNSLGAEYTIIGPNAVINRLLWPFEMGGADYLGDDLDFQVNRFPMLTKKGCLATVDDVDVYVGSIAESGSVSITRGSKVVSDMSADFSNVSVGDTIIIYSPNYRDRTLVYTVENIVDTNTLTLSSKFPPTDLVPPNFGLDVYPYKIINYLEVEDAVTSIRPLLGHVRLNFLPPAGSFIKFEYYHNHYNRRYVMVPDSLDGGVPDTVFNSYNNYTIIPDIANSQCPYTADEIILKIGYRYRVFNLSNSSVLNSTDTFSLNSYEKEGSRASFKNRGGVLNEFDLMFSPEYLTDTDQNIVLSDKYLEKDIPATTELYKGTPPFVKSFSDDAHFVEARYADQVDTYEGQTATHKDLQAGFTIIDPDRSGDIDYNKVCEYPTKQETNLHSDLKINEFYNEGGKDLPLSTIYEGDRVLPISTTMIEQYYPNRELRVNDYLDFVNKVPDDLASGTVIALNGSRIIKSNSTDLRNLRRGDSLTLKNVAVIRWDEFTGTNKIYYEDQKYVVTNIFDYATAEVNTPFVGASNKYTYDLERDIVYNVDVYLNEVQRKLILNSTSGHTYSLPDSFLQHYPGYGDPITSYVLSFPDPDPDPYPRNPNNPDITGLPSGDPNTLFTDYIGQESQVPLTSEVIYSDGSNYITGISGYTGPSGAVDLGLTGPIGAPNPRLPSADNDPLYSIPSAESGVFLSYSESEYRAQWRNWDQDMIIIGLGETGAPTGQQGILVEDPVNMLDDIGEGISRSFWSVDKYAAGSTGIISMSFFGSVIESSEQVEASVPKATYSDALIPLDNYQSKVIASAYRGGLDPVLEYPEFNLNDASYEHRKLIIRELLHDNSFRITEVRQYAPI